MSQSDMISDTEEASIPIRFSGFFLPVKYCVVVEFSVARS